MLDGVRPTAGLAGWLRAGRWSRHRRIGEAAALVLRLLFAPLADRTGRYWTLTIVGYALTAVCVALLAFTPSLGAAGLAVTAVLIVAERIGKSVRSPAKSALLADAVGQVVMDTASGCTRR